jgi:hypothetical protein
MAEFRAAFVPEQASDDELDARRDMGAPGLSAHPVVGHMKPCVFP